MVSYLLCIILGSMIPTVLGDCDPSEAIKLRGTSGTIKYNSNSKTDKCEWQLPVEHASDYAVVLTLTHAELKCQKICTGRLLLPGSVYGSCRWDTPHCLTLLSQRYASQCNIEYLKQVAHSAEKRCAEQEWYLGQQWRSNIKLEALAKDVGNYSNSFILKYEVVKCKKSDITVTHRCNIFSSTSTPVDSKQRDQTQSLPATTITAVFGLLFTIACLVVVVLIYKLKKSHRQLRPQISNSTTYEEIMLTPINPIVRAPVGTPAIRTQDADGYEAPIRRDTNYDRWG